MSDPTRYPLSWPHGRPRTSWNQRRTGRFGKNGEPITVARATERLLAELNRLGAIYVLISTDIETRRDGLPKSGQRAPDDPGVCAYFTLKAKPFALACDTFNDLAQNIAALAAHVEATRAIERYGVASAAETLQAFSALPAPKTAAEVLGVSPAASKEEIQQAWRRAITENHPDRLGTNAAAAEINAARDTLLRGAT